MTVYNEADFIEYAIRSCLPYVDHLVIVEGAYKQVIALGKPERSSDGTLEIIEKYRNNPNVHIIFANEKTDKDQRNVGLQKIKELNPDGWMLVVDGDEIYDPSTFSMIKSCANTMEKNNKYAVYFKSLTFVNNANFYCEQEFPRLFRITPGAEFCNDNFLEWSDKNLKWGYPHVVKIPYIRYYHFSFCKGSEKFLEKRNWWMNRGLGKDFDYGWKLDENGQITDDNHNIYEHTGKFPAVMKDHPLFKK